MHEWVGEPLDYTGAQVPVQACLLGCLTPVTYTVQPGCEKDLLGALGTGALTGAPRGPEFRDDTYIGTVASLRHTV